MTQRIYHPTLAADRWQQFSYDEQLGNIGSETSRSLNAYGIDQVRLEGAVARGVELFDLTIQDPRWVAQRSELIALKERFIRSARWVGGDVDALKEIDDYLFQFALRARSNR